MALGIGYNINKAEELMSSIGDAYTSLGTTISAEWPAVSSSLRTNWVGEDELHYEEQVVKRINEMYQNAYVLANIAIGTIGGLAEGWWNFQKKNVFEGESEIESMGNITIEIPTITKNESILTFETVSYSNTDDRGLKDASSATTIKGAVDSFVSNVKSKMTELLDMDASSAFFGDQTAKIKAYLEAVSNSMVNVSLAIKDLYTCLDSMASTNYSSQTTASTEFIGTEEATVNEQVANVAESTRWT